MKLELTDTMFFQWDRQESPMTLRMVNIKDAE